MSKMLKLTLTKSRFGRLPKHRATLLALRLLKIGRSVTVPNAPQWQGMARQVAPFIKIEYVEK